MSAKGKVIIYPKEEVEDRTISQSPRPEKATKVARNPASENEFFKTEEGDDGSSRSPALAFPFEDHSAPANYLPILGDHEMSYRDLNTTRYSMRGTNPPFSPFTNHRFVVPSFRGFPSDRSGDHNFDEAFDMSTQGEGVLQGQSSNPTPSSLGRAVDLQRIPSLRSSSNEVGEEGETYHDSMGGPGFHTVHPRLSNIPSVLSDNAAFLQDPLFSSFDIPFTPQVYYPHNIYTDAYQSVERHTSTQSTRRARASPTAALMPAEGNEDEDSSQGQKPTVSPIISSGKAKVKTTKAVPKKKAKPTPKRSRFFASQNFNGSTSSSSPGEVSDHEYGHIGPNPEELAGAKTERARMALLSWYERLRDLIKFRERYGHTRVPQKYSKNRELGIWVNKQRMEKKSFDEGNSKSSMNPTKIAKLEAAGFVWAKPKGVDAWEQKFEELLQYVEEKGNPDVPTKYPCNRALGRWVSTQRNMYKRYHSDRLFNNLSQEETERRIGLLQSLGFSWSMAQISNSDTSNNDESHEDGHHGDYEV